MINRTKTGPLHLLKFALLVPIAMFLLLAFRNKQEVYTTPSKEKTPITKTYILSSLTYSIPDKKIEAAVKKDQNESLLKTGEALNLELVYNERIRLKNLLEKSGYNNIGKHAITFMIDTTLGNNSFSVQVNINLAKDQVSKAPEKLAPQNKITTSATHIESSDKAIMSVLGPNNHGASNSEDEDEVRSQTPAYDSKFSVN